MAPACSVHRRSIIRLHILPHIVLACNMIGVIKYIARSCFTACHALIFCDVTQIKGQFPKSANFFKDRGRPATRQLCNMTLTAQIQCASASSPSIVARSPRALSGVPGVAARQARRRQKGSGASRHAGEDGDPASDNSGKFWPITRAPVVAWHGSPTELVLAGVGLDVQGVCALVASLLGQAAALADPVVAAPRTRVARGACLLATLDLGDNPLGDAGVAALVPLLCGAPLLVTLGLSSVRLTAAAPLPALLAAGAALRHLHLAGNRALGNAGLTALSKHHRPPAPPPCTLLTLDLADTGLTAAAASTWPQFWAAFGASLTSLTLAHNPGVWPGNGCHRATALRHLALDACALGPEAGSLGALGNLGALEALEHLTLAGNALGDPGAAALALALRPNTRLAALDLAHTGLGDAAGRALGFLLATHPGLRRLDVQRNPSFGDAGVDGLGNVLRLCPTSAPAQLQSLHMGHTALSPGGVQRLVAVLRESLPACANLDLSGTCVGITAVAALVTLGAVEDARCSGKDALSCSGSRSLAVNAAALMGPPATASTRTRTLEVFDLSSTGIGSAGCWALACTVHGDLYYHCHPNADVGTNCALVRTAALIARLFSKKALDFGAPGTQLL